MLIYVILIILDYTESLRYRDKFLFLWGDYRSFHAILFPLCFKFFCQCWFVPLLVHFHLQCTSICRVAKHLKHPSLSASVIKHFSFHRSLNLGNRQKPSKPREPGTWKLMSLFVETSLSGTNLYATET